MRQEQLRLSLAGPNFTVTVASYEPSSSRSPSFTPGTQSATGRDILARAKTQGASQGDVVMVESDSFFVTVRLGEVEKISQAQEKRLGLRLFFGAIYRCINNATYMSFIRSQITLHLFGILLDAAKR